jgi:hypothetical protein
LLPNPTEYFVDKSRTTANDDPTVKLLITSVGRLFVLSYAPNWTFVIVMVGTREIETTFVEGRAVDGVTMIPFNRRLLLISGHVE